MNTLLALAIALCIVYTVVSLIVRFDQWLERRRGSKRFQAHRWW